MMVRCRRLVFGVRLDVVIGQGNPMVKGLGLILQGFYWTGSLLDRVIIGSTKKLNNFKK